MPKALAAVAVVLAVAAAVAWGAGDGAAELLGFPVPWWCAAIAFVVQWLAFVPAYLQRTEKFYDLVGSLTYLTVVWFALLSSGEADVRSVLVTGIVSIWAARLGTFLFRRVHRQGGDRRFDDIKTEPGRFLVAWTLQGLWVFLTLSAGIAAITSTDPAPFGAIDVVGGFIWAFGFAIEVVADRQKSRFREEHPDDFIDVGLWAWSRHPNYFGEIVLWIGVAVIASSTLSGWQWVTLISPVFVIVLLTKISGIPMLEERAEEKWGDDPDYQDYRERTPVLVPRPPG